MPTPPPNVNDGSGQPPRLILYGNEWGLSELPQLPRSRAWTLEETLDKLVAAGFGGYQAGPAAAEAARARGLRFCMAGRVNCPEEAGAAAQYAAAAGADCLTVHAGWGMESDAEADAVVQALLEASSAHGVPLYIETHRATLAQDIWRTNQMVRRIPEIRFNGDFSHFYCGQEMTYPGFENSRKSLTEILKRVSFLHGRISDGECMQVDVGDGTESPHARNFQSLWQEAMGYWLRSARPGDILPFTPELGPPSSGYSITYRNAAGDLVEISDRWQQSLVLKRLAEDAFAAAQSSPK